MGQLKRYKLQRLPPYIILHYKRFTKNNFVEEKNPTIVNFPLRGVDFRECRCHIVGLSLLIHDNAILDLDAPPDHPSTLYDLLSNVTHESVAGTTRDKANTVWKIHLRAGGGGGDGERWFEVQDLIVQEVRKEMIFLGESVLQVTCISVSFVWSVMLNVFRYGNAEMHTRNPMPRTEWILHTKSSVRISIFFFAFVFIFVAAKAWRYEDQNHG